MKKNKKVSDFFLMNITVKECNEKLVSLRDYSKDIIIKIDSFSKRYEKLKDEECLVRETVAIMLSQAQSILPNGYYIKIFDGFRSLKTQEKIYEMVKKELKENHPSWTKKKIILETDKWVANPKTIPPHSTGGAVDVTIVNEKQEEIVMGTKLNSISRKSITYSKEISNKEKKNRNILIKAMKKVGFTNYPAEWWHWSYGDRMWAYYKKKRFGIYEGIK